MSLLRLPNSVEISVIRPLHLTAAVTHTSPVVECVDYLEMTTYQHLLELCRKEQEQSITRGQLALI